MAEPENNRRHSGQSYRIAHNWMNHQETVFCDLFYYNSFWSFNSHYIKINKECKLNSEPMDGAR